LTVACISPQFGIVGQQCEVEIEARSLWADRDAADGGESIAAIPARQQRSFSLRRPGATHGRRQHEAAFVEKNDVCVAFSSGFEG
jgi:hypothetical protein